MVNNTKERANGPKTRQERRTPAATHIMDPPGPSNVAEGAGSAELVDLSQDESSDLSPRLSHPAIKRLKRAHAQSPGSGGRPQSPLWDLFDRSERKQNVSHYTAYCMCCIAVGKEPKGVTGKAEDMRAHLIKCQHASPALKKWAMDWTAQSQPFVEDQDLPGSSQQSSASQSGLSKYAAFKDKALTASQRQEFDLLLLKGTVSANLPFAWIDNPYIKEAFGFIRPQVQLPSRRSLAGELF